jgi:hypothetical protein
MSGERRAEGPVPPPEGPAPGPPTAAPRPLIERLGLAAIAIVMGALFAAVAVASAAGGEWVLAAMSGVGAGMTLIVGGITLLRG